MSKFWRRWKKGFVYGLIFFFVNLVSAVLIQAVNLPSPINKWFALFGQGPITNLQILVGFSFFLAMILFFPWLRGLIMEWLNARDTPLQRRINK